MANVVQNAPSRRMLARLALFFHWLERRGLIQENPFDQVVFPKVGRSLIHTNAVELMREQ